MAYSKTMLNLLEASLTPATWYCYTKSINTILEFMHISLHLKPSLPIPVAVLCAFICHKFEQGSAPTSLISYTCAISYFHKLYHLPDPSQSTIIKIILKGAKKLSGKSDTRLPISQNILSSLVASLEHMSLSHYVKILLKAMYMTAFHAFLRVGEMTSSRANHNISYHSVQFDFSNNIEKSYTLTFTHFKHSTRPVSIQIIQAENKLRCPVEALLEFYRIRGHTPGPLFCFPGAGCAPVSRKFFSDHLNCSLLWAGLNPKLYKGHSFRIGAATAAVQSGKTEQQIQAMGRWHSNAYKNYIRIPSLQL